MCGSGRLETSCHSRAMMTGRRKTERGSFAEKAAKLAMRRIPLSLRGTVLPKLLVLLKSTRTEMSHLDDKRTTLRSQLT